HRLYRGLHRRGGAPRHPVGAVRAERIRACARLPVQSRLAADRAAAGDACDHPAADEPIPHPGEELIACRGGRLSRPGAGVHRHCAQSDRAGGRGGGHHHGGLPVDQPVHVAGDEHLQPRDHAGGGSVMTMAEGELARAEIAFVRGAYVAPLPPPPGTTGAIGWMRANLFSSVFNSILTVVMLVFVVWLGVEIVNFLIRDAVWTGADRAACIVSPEHPRVGACWPFVWERLNYFIYGSYPVAERWRVDIFFAMLAVGVVWILWLDSPRRDL